MALTSEQAQQIEHDHNVYVDADTMQYTVDGGRDAIYGWMPIPQDWIDTLTDTDQDD